MKHEKLSASPGIIVCTKDTESDYVHLWNTNYLLPVIMCCSGTVPGRHVHPGNLGDFANVAA